MIGGVGTTEIAVVVIIALILFGPNKLPELARAVGSAIGEFKIAQKAAEFDLSDIEKYSKEQDEKKKADAKALDDKIRTMALEAGIDPEGKKPEELLLLMSDKMKSTETLSADTEIPEEEPVMTVRRMSPEELAELSANEETSA
ncbi:twin-arginine translocase TatA/TatE family subunit [Methanolapillus millepedarum]|uniref:Sec-independent protein translocase protein TatA n=1 Tax=Methanolapillus millepedarum TaxID=3028296 RepID=A0AA96V2Q9_9EURY|nr:Sec-independent protein translocase protein TatA [Methanosarcinaceae archaeon Ac7]